MLRACRAEKLRQVFPMGWSGNHNIPTIWIERPSFPPTVYSLPSTTTAANALRAEGIAGSSWKGSGFRVYGSGVCRRHSGFLLKKVQSTRRNRCGKCLDAKKCREWFHLILNAWCRNSLSSGCFEKNLWMPWGAGIITCHSPVLGSNDSIVDTKFFPS